MVGAEMPAALGTFNTITRASGCLHRIPVSQNSGKREARRIRQIGTPPVDLAGDRPASQAGLLPAGWNHPVVRVAETADSRYQELPISSLYRRVMRGMRQIAGGFAGLLNTVCFLCSFQPHYAKNQNVERH